MSATVSSDDAKAAIAIHKEVTRLELIRDTKANIRARIEEGA